MNTNVKRSAALVAVVMALAAIGTGTRSNASGATRRASDFTVEPNTVTEISSFKGAKSHTGRLAESDPTLLGRTDSTPVNIVVKLDYDATASYGGDISGLAATSPSVTSRPLTGNSGAERNYEAYTAGIEDQFRRDLAANFPTATPGQSLRRVYGGIAVKLPANQASRLLSLSNVAAVQVDELQKIQTDSSTTFIGAPTIWAQNGGQALAGHGVIFGDLDTGVWPEHPSFADNPALGTPPPTSDGHPRACNFGDNPLTAVSDVFVCNRKLIGGQPFLATYNAAVGGDVYPNSARDSNGHGTHTTSTAAGDIVSSAPIFGVERGPISGVAPGAWVISYKVCGLQGCFGSDSAAAVQQAIVDGVDVINFSIGGGSNPYADPVEMAFLDAYNAGVLVAASAGNSGPGPATASHLGPWTLTVAASTQTRQFQSTITVTDGPASATFVGSSITHGITTATPIVMAKDIPGYSAQCLTVPTADQALLIAGKIVGCQRGGDAAGRVFQRFRIVQAGAAGMILYNLPLQDTETDNHFLPAVHLADGTEFVAFMTAHPNASGSFTDGVKADGQGDVMASFSSRGPGGQFLKPDITAPGVQILAGNTPTPDEVPAGPAGQYFQAIAGTSMSSPHAAGSAILLQSLHPDWTPGMIKSALMTTAITKVVKEDLVTPADPFDFGAGRIDLTQAGAAGLVFDESAMNMFVNGQNPIAALDLNLPSINVPTMPGTVTVTRTATNVTGRDIEFKASTTAPAGSSITVSPRVGRIRSGASRTFTVTIKSSAPVGQYFGEIQLIPKRGPAIHLPVAFYNQQGAVTLAQTCAAETIKRGLSTTCTVTATNESFVATNTSVSSQVSDNLRITGATGATITGRRTASLGPVSLAAKQDAIPAIGLGPTPAGVGADGYLDLGAFGVTARSIGDEEAVNFGVPPFVFGGKTYNRVGVVSNGYLVLGGSTGSSDIVCCPPQTLPDPTRPNGVLAPYWTDLDGGTGYGIRISALGDGVNSWLIVQWNVRLFGATTPDGNRNMQVWIGLNGVEDVSYGYLGGGQPDAPAGAGLTVGAENDSGRNGAQIVGPPVGSYVVTTTPGIPGGSATYTLTVLGERKGSGGVTSSMTADIVAGSTIVTTRLNVVR